MAELEKEMQDDASDVADAWGNDGGDLYATTNDGNADQGEDLMDVNADQDDWSESLFLSRNVTPSVLSINVNHRQLLSKARQRAQLRQNCS